MDLEDEFVAVVVVTFNSAPLLADLFASMDPGMDGMAYQIVVVDNASSDNSVAAARALRPDAIIVETGRNGGYAAGINAGVRAAPAYTCVMVLNPDVRLGIGCVPALIQTLHQPRTGVAVPRLHDRDGKRIDTMRREPTIRRILADAFLGAERVGRIGTLGEVVTNEAAYEDEAVTDWAEGSTQLISAQCWEACGPWDESFFLYSEETEFGLRARDHGLPTRYTPHARAVHLEGDSGQSPPLWALLALNRVRLYRRRNGWVLGVGFWAALLVREGSRAALGKQTSQAAVRALLSPRRLRERPGPETIRPPERRSSRP